MTLGIPISLASSGDGSLEIPKMKSVLETAQDQKLSFFGYPCALVKAPSETGFPSTHHSLGIPRDPKKGILGTLIGIPRDSKKGVIGARGIPRVATSRSLVIFRDSLGIPNYTPTLSDRCIFCRNPETFLRTPEENGTYLKGGSLR